MNQHALVWSSTVAVFACILLLPWLRRAALRRRTVGALHCRRCDYNVTGVAPASPGTPPLCPECGVNLAARPPLRGVKRFRRLWLPVTLLTLVLVPYAWFATTGRRTYPHAIPEGRWGSRTLERWSSAAQLSWLRPASVQGDLLLELDAATGETRRVIAARASTTHFPMVYSPFADAVLLSGGSERLDLVSVSTGSTITSLIGHPPNMGDVFPNCFMGHDETGDKVYLNCAAGKQSRSWIAEWNWRTGGVREFASCAAPVLKSRFEPRQFAMIPSVPRRFFRHSSFSESYDTKHFLTAVLDAEGRVLVERDFDNIIDCMAKPVFNRDGTLTMLPETHGRNIRVMKTATLADADEVVGGDGTARTPVAGPQSRLLFIPGHRRIGVRDMVRTNRGTTLLFPDELYAPRSFSFSADGCTVCAVFQSDNGQGKYVFQLAVWRLPQSLAVPPPQHPAKN